MNKRYTLGKNERLKSRKGIEQIFAVGKSFAQYPLRVLYIELDEPTAPTLQCAFSASTRHFKRAVQRNRVKRLMREAWRLQKNELTEHLEGVSKKLAVFIIYTNSELPAYSLVFEKTSRLIQRLIEKIGKDNEAVL